MFFRDYILVNFSLKHHLNAILYLVMSTVAVGAVYAYFCIFYCLIMQCVQYTIRLLNFCCWILLQASFYQLLLKSMHVTVLILNLQSQLMHIYANLFANCASGASNNLIFRFLVESSTYMASFIVFCWELYEKMWFLFVLQFFWFHFSLFVLGMEIGENLCQFPILFWS